VKTCGPQSAGENLAGALLTEVSEESAWGVGRVMAHREHVLQNILTLRSVAPPGPHLQPPCLLFPYSPGLLRFGHLRPSGVTAGIIGEAVMVASDRAAISLICEFPIHLDLHLVSNHPHRDRHRTCCTRLSLTFALMTGGNE
jgi:hypothetical protein